MITEWVVHVKAVLHAGPIGQVHWLDWLSSQLIDFLTGPFTGQRTRSYWPELLAALAIAAVVFVLRERKSGQGLRAYLNFSLPRSQYLHPSTWVDCKLILANHFIIPVINVTWRLSTAWFTGILMLAMVWMFGPAPHVLAWTPLTILLFTILIALAEDFGFFVFHLAAHRVPWMWAFHRVHHSAETLQVCANVRVHPIEIVVTGPFRGAASALVLAPALYFAAGEASFTTILGMNLMVAFYMFAGVQLHHSNIWLSWGPVLEHIFISPAQHQIHHSAAPEHWNRNMGGNFALWDWMFGTLTLAGPRQTLTYGLGGEHPQPHPTLRAAYLEPFVFLVPAPLRDRFVAFINRARRPTEPSPDGSTLQADPGD